jgi:hypothetical protein
MDTQPIGVQGMAPHPNGDGRKHHDGSGQRQSPHHRATDQETSPSGTTHDPGLADITERLGATLEHYREQPEFNQIVA